MSPPPSVIGDVPRPRPDGRGYNECASRAGTTAVEGREGGEDRFRAENSEISEGFGEFRSRAREGVELSR